LVIALFPSQRPSHGIINYEFDELYTPKMQQVCCSNCLAYGDYKDSKDCYEIIKEHGGAKSCYMIMSTYPHTFSQCKQLISE